MVRIDLNVSSSMGELGVANALITAATLLSTLEHRAIKRFFSCLFRVDCIMCCRAPVTLDALFLSSVAGEAGPSCICCVLSMLSSSLSASSSSASSWSIPRPLLDAFIPFLLVHERALGTGATDASPSSFLSLPRQGNIFSACSRECKIWSWTSGSLSSFEISLAMCWSSAITRAILKLLNMPFMCLKTSISFLLGLKMILLLSSQVNPSMTTLYFRYTPSTIR